VISRILKIGIISGGLILMMDYANRMLNDADTIFPVSIAFKSADPDDDPRSVGEKTGWTEYLPASPGLGWVQADFQFSEKTEEFFGSRKRELIVSFLGAYELYWNGIRVGKNGNPSGVVSGEKPGVVHQKFILPDSLLGVGHQQLLLRFSDQKNTARHQLARFSIEPYNEYFKRSQAQAILVYTLAGIFLLVAIYYFFLFFNTYRNFSFMLFALLCGVSFILIVYAYSGEYLPYTYGDYPFRQSATGFLSWTITLLLPLFYLYYFEHPHKKVMLAGMVLLLLSTRFLPENLRWTYTAAAVLIPVYLVIWALVRRKKGGTEAMIGLIVFVASYMYFNASVYVGFGVLVIATLFSLSITLGLERKKQESFIARSIRLESELLKKNIQPHFLMNTLTNIISLIESDPKLSVQLIEALSAEFYSMMDIADKKLIPIGQEIELCKAHLTVMSIRNDAQYEINTDQVDNDQEIPPAVLHTLIENGITHNRPLNGMIRFDLSDKVQAGQRVIVLRTFAAAKKAYHLIKEGIGMKYIKSRLEESFPNRWELYGAPTNFGWESKIIIKQ